jgi:hypothetical protein
MSRKKRKKACGRRFSKGAPPNTDTPLNAGKRHRLSRGGKK